MDKSGHIVGSAMVPTGMSAAKGAENALAAALEDAGLAKDSLDVIIATGYGRDALGFPSVTEITCHAKGARFLFGGAQTVIDIGGQDSKIIRIDEEGNVLNFIMNDKCAAGTGRFLEMQARALGLSMEEMSKSVIYGLLYTGIPFFKTLILICAPVSSVKPFAILLSLFSTKSLIFISKVLSVPRITA